MPDARGRLSVLVLTREGACRMVASFTIRSLLYAPGRYLEIIPAIHSTFDAGGRGQCSLARTDRPSKIYPRFALQRP